MVYSKKSRILITLIIVILIFTPCTGTFAASVNQGRQLLNEGVESCKRGDYYGTAIKCEKALRIFEEYHDKEGMSDTMVILGGAYLHLGQIQKALGLYEKALDMARETGDRVWEGITLVSIGYVYSFFGQPRKALDYFEKALSLYREIDNIMGRMGETTSLNYIGGIYSYFGDYKNALSYHEKALAIARKIGDKISEGSCLESIGGVYSNLGQYQKALRYHEKALAICKEIGDKISEGGHLKSIGGVYSNLGQYQQALAYHEKALSMARESGDKVNECSYLGGIGVIYSKLGQYQKALSYYEKSLAIYKEIGNRHGEGAILGNIGIVYWYLGQYQKALSCFEKSLVIHRNVDNKRGEGAAFGNIGNVYHNLGQYRKALSYFEKTLAISREIRNRKDEGDTLGNIGGIYWGIGQYQKALRYYKKALAIKMEIGVPTDTEEYSIGDIYLETGRMDMAEEIYERLGGPLYLGRLFLVKKDYVKAIEYFHKSLKDDLKNRRAEFLFADYTGLGLSYEGVKDYGKAKEFYLSAIELIEEIRDSLTPGQRSSFFAVKMGFSRLAPYEGLIRVLNRLKQVDLSFHYAEYTRARLLAESIASTHEGVTMGLPPRLAAEEEDIASQIAALYKERQKAYSQNRMEAYKNIERRIREKKEKQGKIISRIRKDYPEYASIKYPQPLKASEIPLKKNEYLVEYEVTDNAAFVWLMHEGRIIKSITIPINRKELAGLVKKYRTYFQVSRKSDLAQFDPKTGHKLYTLLMKDILGSVPKESHIVIVPDEILGVLPFEALVSQMPKRYQMAEGNKGPFPLGIRYVGDERNISYYQSATALAMIRSLRQKTKAAKPMLVVADPVFDVSDARLRGKLAKVTKYQMNLMRAVEDEGGFSFPRLEQTSVLAGRLDKNFNNSADVLEGLNATYANLKKRDLKKYRYLVFATHGILDNQVPGIKEPALVLTQLGNPEDEDGFLTMSEVMDLKLDATCSALTACETGLGKNVSGEGVMGMGRAFQYAGTKSVLVSLWSVAEESTTKLTERFFYYLKIGKKSQEALKLARTDIRRDGYEHPFYWAPFILIGE